MFGVGVSLWKTTILGGGFVGTAPIVADQPLDFGALTLENAGADLPVNTGAAITDITITSGDASGHWNASILGYAPSAAGVAAGLNLGPYDLVSTIDSASGSDTATITITPTANDYTVNDLTELNAVIALGAVTLNNKTALLRDGTYGSTDPIDVLALTVATRFTISGTLLAATSGFDLIGSTNITIDGVSCFRDWQAADGSTGNVIDTGTTTGVIVRNCDIGSDDFNNIDMKAGIECLSGVGDSANLETTDLIVEDNTFQYTVLPVTILGDNVTVERNDFLHCFQSFGQFNDNDGIVYKDNRGHNIWAHGGGIGDTGPNNPGGDPGLYPYDFGDPHSSLLGFNALTNGVVSQNHSILGNILMIGTGRFDALGDYIGTGSGPKWNDTYNDTLNYDTVECAYNAFFPTDGLGLDFGLGTNFNIHHNLALVDEATQHNPSNTALRYRELTTGSKAWCNISMTITEGTLGAAGVSEEFLTACFDNICAVPEGDTGAAVGSPMSYPVLFNGTDFNGLSVSEIEAAYTPQAGGRLLAGSINIGPFGTSYYDFDTGVETAPTYVKPITTTATGVAATKVIFDGTNDYSRGVDATDPFFGFTDGNIITFIFGLEIDPTMDDTNFYVTESAGASLQIRHIASTNKLRLKLENAANESIMGADIGLTMTSDDGYVVWTVSMELDNYNLRVMKGTNLDGLVSVTRWEDDVYDINRNSTAFMAQDSGGGKVFGEAGFFYLTDEYIEMHTVANLDKIIALDGQAPAYGATGSTVTGTAPRAYLQGDAAAWNHIDGLNLGSSSEVFDIVGAVADVAAQVITFDSADWIDFGADFTGNQTEGVIAFRYTRTKANGSGNHYMMTSGAGTSDSVIRWRDDNGDIIAVRIENNVGGATLNLSGPSIAQDASASIFIRLDSGSSELWVDGSRVGSISTNSFTSFKSLEFFNSSDDAGTDADDQALVGGLWISHASGVADVTTGLGYSDFFDGSDLPIFGTGSVGGFAPDVALTTIAEVNAYAGFTGEVD